MGVGVKPIRACWKQFVMCLKATWFPSGVPPCAATTSALLLAAGLAFGTAALPGIFPCSAAASAHLPAPDVATGSAVLSGVSSRAPIIFSLLLAAALAFGPAVLLRAAATSTLFLAADLVPGAAAQTDVHG